MATGHQDDKAKSVAQVYGMLGTGDGPKLYAQSYTVNHSYDIPYGAGNSVDRSTVYIDRSLYKAIQSGELKVKGLDSGDVLQSICEHEHTEKVIADADNAVDAYGAAHEYGNGKEQAHVKKVGGDGALKSYEDVLDPFLADLYQDDPKKLPKDLWCGPYLDEPTPRDEELLKIFKQAGLPDAFKSSKAEAHYGIGEQECRDCKHYTGTESADQIGLCDKVSGLVRFDRHCDWWTKV